MPSFIQPTGTGPNFGRRNYLRSTRELLTNSATFSAASFPTQTPAQTGGLTKELRAGTVLALITSGAEAGKVGAFQAGVTDGRQTLANIVGLCDTYLPYQLESSDREVSVVYGCVASKPLCWELNAAGAYIALTDTTADALNGGQHLRVYFN
jgi:hypothetical protein